MYKANADDVFEAERTLIDNGVSEKYVHIVLESVYERLTNERLYTTEIVNETKNIKTRALAYDEY